METAQSNEVATLPAPVEQIAVETKGAANLEESAFAKRLLEKSLSKQQAPIAEEKAPVETPSAVPAETEVTEPSAETPTEEPKTEEKSEAEEPKEEEVLSPETQTLDPKLQAKIDRRIGKEVAKRKALEAQVAELTAKVSAVVPAVVDETPVIVPVAQNVPLPQINTVQELESLKQTAKTEIRWAEAHLDNDDFPKEGMMTERGWATKADLKAIIRNAKVCQEDLIPARERFLNERATAQKTAAEQFAFLKDPTRPEYQLAKQAIKDNPWLHGMANMDYLVGVMVKGKMALDAEKAAVKPVAEKASVKPKAKPTAGQSDVVSDASTSRVPVGVMNAQALENEKSRVKALRGVGQNDYAAHLVRTKQLRSTR